MTRWTHWWILDAASLAIALAGAAGLAPPAGTSATPVSSCPAATPGATPVGEVGTPLASPTSPGHTPTEAAFQSPPCPKAGGNKSQSCSSLGPSGAKMRPSTGLVNSVARHSM